MSFDGYTEPEIQRWLHLRAIEWSGFPSFVSQIIAPILFIFYPWWQVVLGIIVVGLVWCFVRYWFISAAILDTTCLLVVWFKWPVAIGSAVYLLLHRQFVAGVAALVWPVVAGLTIPPGQVGVFELRLAKRIGYVAPDTVSFSFPSRLIAFAVAVFAFAIVLTLLMAFLFLSSTVATRP